MTVLRSGISAHTTVVTVDAPLSNPSYPIFYDLDSETIKVVDGADTTEWQVERGVADTQQARHAKNVLLVANANPYGGGGGGVSVDNTVDAPTAVTSIIAPGAVIADGVADLSDRLVIRRVGPFVLSFDTPGLGFDYSNDTKVLASLPAGSLLFYVGAWVTALWVTSGADLRLKFGAYSQFFKQLNIVNGGVNRTSPYPGGSFVQFGLEDELQVFGSTQDDPTPAVLGLTQAQLPVNVETASDLYVTINADVAPTAGSVTVVFLVATPAS